MHPLEQICYLFMPLNGIFFCIASQATSKISFIHLYLQSHPKGQVSSCTSLAAAQDRVGLNDCLGNTMDSS